MMELVFSLVGLLLGIFSAGIWADNKRKKASMAYETEIISLQEKHNHANLNLATLEERIKAQTQQNETLSSENKRLDTENRQLIQERERLNSQLAETSALLESEHKNAAEKLALLQSAKEELSNQFKSLAGAILDEKTKKFTEQNEQNLGHLLNPLKTQLQDFKNTVDGAHKKDIEDRAALKQQVENLYQLNHQLSADAHSLTSALKGQTKTQGNWGEIILERVLEASGLQKGREYEVQASHTREDGSRVQPDVIIRLPGGRCLIVDAKVSLNAYEQYTQAETDVERDNALKVHVQSVRKHIEGLSNKNYESLEMASGVTLDFTVMFMSIEPAYMLAISQDNQLWGLAWKKNILLVSPSTFLFVVRTVAHLWRQEQLGKSALDIAKRGGELYDKFVAFVEDLEKVGERLGQTQKAYDGAHNKLISGKGNLIRQAENLKLLGVKPSKRFPDRLMGDSIDDDTTDSVIPETD